MLTCIWLFAFEVQYHALVRKGFLKIEKCILQILKTDFDLKPLLNICTLCSFFIDCAHKILLKKCSLEPFLKFSLIASLCWIFCNLKKKTTFRQSHRNFSKARWKIAELNCKNLWLFLDCRTRSVQSSNRAKICYLVLFGTWLGW